MLDLGWLACPEADPLLYPGQWIPSYRYGLMLLPAALIGAVNLFYEAFKSTLQIEFATKGILEVLDHLIDPRSYVSSQSHPTTDTSPEQRE